MQRWTRPLKQAGPGDSQHAALVAGSTPSPGSEFNAWHVDLDAGSAPLAELAPVTIPTPVTVHVPIPVAANEHFRLAGAARSAKIAAANLAANSRDGLGDAALVSRDASCAAHNPGARHRSQRGRQSDYRSGQDEGTHCVISLVPLEKPTRQGISGSPAPAAESTGGAEPVPANGRLTISRPLPAA